MLKGSSLTLFADGQAQHMITQYLHKANCMKNCKLVTMGIPGCWVSGQDLVTCNYLPGSNPGALLPLPETSRNGEDQCKP